MNIKYIFSFIIFFSSLLYSQSYNTLKGKIYDEISGEKIFGVHIMIKELNKDAVRDTSGYFTIKNVPNGKYMVTFQYLGYPTQRDTIMVEGNAQIYNLNRALKRYCSLITKNPQIEEYQLRLKKLAQKDSLLRYMSIT